MKKIHIAAFCASIFTSFAACAASSSHSEQRADLHAPISVMRDHVHAKGDSMLSYRFSQMSMRGLRNGNGEVLKENAHSDYMMLPKNMKMKMHMVSFMHGLTNDLTVAISSSYITKSMEVERRNGAITKMETVDIGDTKVNALYQFFSNKNSSAQLNLGVSVPTGESSEYQANGRSRMAYPMQNGSGSYEFLPGLSYKFLQDSYSVGAQVNGVFRMNSNDNGYKFGDEYNVTIWAAKPIIHNFSISSRLDYRYYEAIEGVDSQIAGAASNNPIFDPSLGEGEKLYGYVGSNYIFTSSILKGNRVALEFGKPLYQRIDGPFLQDKYRLVLGWQKSF